MPNTRSAKKRMRQTEKRRFKNRAAKSVVKTYTRKTVQAIEAGDVAEAERQFAVMQKRVDKAAKANAIHRNKASRRKSRLQKRLNALKAGDK